MKSSPFYSLALTALATPSLLAQVVAAPDAPLSNQPSIGVTPNNTPLVQIAPPNAAGLSNNHFSQFNVDARGAILNNAQDAVMTQLGGTVAGHAGLSEGSAGIILNQVVGTHPSLLTGAIEVAGQRADVVIANPNGITCNGASFINASRGVLTTGVPVLGAHSGLDAFRVTGGHLEIGPGGLKGLDCAAVDLIARSVQVNGEIRTDGQLQVITGPNAVDYANRGVSVLPDPAGSPTVGLDVGLLGGMYANKIHLVGTEQGVGVCNQKGTLVALGGSFSLSANGMVHHGHGPADPAEGALLIAQAGQVNLSGTATAKGAMSVTSPEGIDNQSTLFAQDGITLTSGGAIRNHGARIQSANGDVTLKAGSLLNSNAGVTVVQEIKRQEEKLIQPCGTSHKYPNSELTPTTGMDGVGGCWLVPGPIPGAGSLVSDYTQFTVTRTIQGPRIAESRPAQILAGGNITLSAPEIRNEASQIVAGKAILIPQGHIQNLDHLEQEVTTDRGQAVFSATTWRDGGLFRSGHRERTWTSPTAYNPAPVTRTVAMDLCVVQEHKSNP